jgi:hypothetical protein
VDAADSPHLSLLPTPIQAPASGDYGERSTLSIHAVFVGHADGGAVARRATFTSPPPAAASGGVLLVPVPATVELSNLSMMDRAAIMQLFGSDFRIRDVVLDRTKRCVCHTVSAWCGVVWCCVVGWGVVWCGVVF